MTGVGPDAVEVRLAARFQEIFPGLALTRRVYTFGDGSVQLLAAAVPFEDGPPARFACTVSAALPGAAEGLHEHRFFGFYEPAAPEDADEVAATMELALAGLHRHHLVVAPVDVGHRVPTAPGGALARAGYSHLVADAPWAYWPLAPAFEVDADGLVPGLRVLAVVPARPEEVSVHRASGLSAFLDARIGGGETPLTVKLR